MEGERHSIRRRLALDLFGNDCDRDPLGHEATLRQAAAHFISPPLGIRRPALSPESVRRGIRVSA